MKFLIISLMLGFGVIGAMAAANVEAGHATYNRKCKMCHGPEGKGNPVIAKMMKVTIPDLGSKAVQSKSDQELADIIVKGKEKMRPVRGLSKPQIDGVVKFLRTLAAK